MKFSPKQKEILKIAKEGYLNSEIIQGVFSSPISRKANIERFLAIGILYPVDGGKYKVNLERLNELNGD